MTRSPVYAGADLGGTWLRAAIVDSSGKPLGRARLPAPPLGGLRAAFKSLFERWRLKPAGLALGAKGAGSAASRRRLEAALSGLAPRVVVLGDIELARLAAFGRGPGVLVVAGTGSGVRGKDGRGRTAREGGLGPFLGDEGSAFWLGREWLRLGPEATALRYARMPRPVSSISALSRMVLRRANRDPRARRLVAQAQKDLARQVQAVRRRLDFKGPVPVCGHGGLFGDAAFARGFFRRLASQGGSWRPVKPRLPAEVAAGRLLALTFCKVAPGQAAVVVRAARRLFWRGATGGPPRGSPVLLGDLHTAS